MAKSRNVEDFIRKILLDFQSWSTAVKCWNIRRSLGYPVVKSNCFNCAAAASESTRLLKLPLAQSCSRHRATTYDKKSTPGKPHDRVRGRAQRDAAARDNTQACARAYEATHLPCVKETLSVNFVRTRCENAVRWIVPIALDFDICRAIIKK